MSNKNLVWPADESKMGRLIYAKDWSETSLGAISDWPQSLHAALNMCLISNSPISICWGEELIFLYNDAWGELNGDHNTSALGQPARKVFEDNWEVFHPEFKRVLSEGEVAESKNQLISFGDGEFLLDFSFSPIPDENGSVSGIFSIATKTAGHTPAEKNLKPDEQELAGFYENSFIGLHWLGPDGIVLRANTTVLNMLGYSRDEYVGHHISDFHADKDTAGEILQKSSANEELHDFECRLKCRDGSIRHVLVSSDVYREEGELVHTRCFIRDITHRKHAGAELMRKVAGSEDRKSLNASAISRDLIYIFDRDYRLIFVNDALLDLWGRTLEETIGKNLFEVGYELWHAEMHEREIERVINTKQPVQGELSLQHEKIGLRRYDYSFVPVLDEKGDVEVVAGTIRDITDHKQIERALRKSEEKYRTLFETIDKGFCIIDVEFDENNKPADWHYLETNQGYEKHTGLKNVVGKDASEILPDLGEDQVKNYGKVLRTGEPSYFESYSKDLERWFEISAYRIGGLQEGKVAVLVDNITEHKQKELTNALLSAIVKSSDDAIISKDLNSIIMSWNEGAEHMFGYTAEEAVGRPITILFPEDRVDEEEEIIGRIKEGKQVDHYETVRKRKDGTLLDVSLTISPVKDSDGNIVGASKIARDITEQKQAEKKLRRNRNRLRTVLEIGTVGVVFWGGNDFTITEVNDAFLEMTGLTREEALGKDWRELTPKEFYPVSKNAVADLKETGHTEPYEKQYIRKDGSRWWGLSAPRRIDENEVVEFLLDITERKEAEKELQEINETLEERVEERTEALLSYQDQLRSLASQLSKAEEQERQRLATELHDNLGQMLTLGKMKVDMLQKKTFPEGVTSDIKRLQKLIDDALTYTRKLMSDLKPPPSLEGEDLRASIRWIVKQMEKHNLEVTVEDDDRPKPVDDEVKITLLQCVRELLFNILKHTSEKEAVIDLRRSDDYLQITVTDEGEGFDTEDKELSPDQQGGFGLFNIRERIDLLGGWFKINSELGRGTAVTLHIPLKEKDQISEAIEQTKEAEQVRDIRQREEAGERIKVLLADDHQMVREGLRKIIDDHDDILVVAEAADGKEALELARETSPDVILMDVNMPVMDGIEATRKISAEMPDVHIIGLSLHDDEDVVSDMRSAGASAYLTKTEALESLIVTVRSEASAPKS